MRISKLYQVHNRVLVSGHVLHGIHYIVAKTPEDAVCCILNLKSTEDSEIYALEVTEKTLGDEIKHKISLIKYWKKRLDYSHVNVTITNLKNQIKYFEEILKDYVWRKTCGQ